MWESPNSEKNTKRAEGITRESIMYTEAYTSLELGALDRTFPVHSLVQTPHANVLQF